MRSLRIRDENAPPQLPAGKTIHHRNKSTPALTALAQAGGLKAGAAKRTVFADVSNTVRQPVAKDDMQLPSKGTKLDVLKETSAKELAKPTALLRPAQRPLATNTTKSNASNGATVVSAVPKHVAPDAGLASANIRKVLSKKATTVFKESHSDPLAGFEPAPVPTRQPIAPRLKTKPSAEHGPIVAEPVVKALSQEASAVLIPTERSTLPEKVAKVEAETKYPAAAAVEVHVELQEKYEYLDALEEQARAIEQERNEELAKSQRLEPEEYWDEDEEEEYYDADGYTTARSLRSRGDNTTGGVTLVLAPRVTAKSQRELEAAKLFVDAHKTAEDIEDEQWDTSMVAEYGEEIFEYMHELEVCYMSTMRRQAFTDSHLGTHEAQSLIHGSSGRDPVVHAIRSYGLDCSGPQPLHSTPRDLVPGCQLCRPLSFVQGGIAR